MMMTTTTTMMDYSNDGDGDEAPVHMHSIHTLAQPDMMMMMTTTTTTAAATMMMMICTSSLHLHSLT